MRKIVLPILILGVVAAIVAIIVISNKNKTSQGNFDNSDQTTQTTSDQPGEQQVTTTTVATLAIPLLPLEDSGQTGRVELRDKGNTVEVYVELTEKAEGTQSAAIRLGNCPTPGEVAFNLKDVTGGKSTSTIEKSMSQLIPELPMTVVVSPTSGSTSYTSCGDLVLPNKAK